MWVEEVLSEGHCGPGSKMTRLEAIGCTHEHEQAVWQIHSQYQITRSMARPGNDRNTCVSCEHVSVTSHKTVLLWLIHLSSMLTILLYIYVKFWLNFYWSPYWINTLLCFYFQLYKTVRLFLLVCVTVKTTTLRHSTVTNSRRCSCSLRNWNQLYALRGYIIQMINTTCQ